MRDPKSEKTIKDAETAIEKMFMEAAQSRIGKYSSPLMIDSHLPTETDERNKIIHDIVEDLQQRIGDYKNKKLTDEEQERKRQLAIKNISERVDKVCDMAMKNDPRTIHRLPVMIAIGKIPFDEIIVGSIIKEKLGF